MGSLGNRRFSGCRAIGRDIPVVLDERRQGDPPALVGSARKAEELLHWRPKYGDIETILEHAWKWYRNKEY